MKDYIPIFRSTAATFYANAPVAVVEAKGGIKAYGLVPMRGSNKCGGESAGEGCYSIAIGSEVDNHPKQFLELVEALKRPCTTFAEKGIDVWSRVGEYVPEDRFKEDTESIRRRLGCDRSPRPLFVTHVEVFEGLDSESLNYVAAERRPPDATIPRKSLRLIRELTVRME